jgi:cell division protein FtsL
MNFRRYRPSFYIFFTLMLILAGMVGTIYIYASINDMRNQINIVRREVQQQRDANTAARTAVMRHYSLEEISRIARDRLGMNRPDPSRTVYINVPRRSFIVQNEWEEPAPELSMWQMVWQHIQGWLQLD